MMKRIICLFCVAALLLSVFPTSVFAATKVNYIPGDVDGNAVVELLDVITLAQYVSDGSTTKPDGYNISLNDKAADVNSDGKADILDVILICQYVSDGSKTDPDGYNVELKPGLDSDAATYSVNFYDGERLIDTLTAKEGQPLGAVPSVEKSSKADATLLGYYTDPAFTQPFYAENPVTGDMNVYAKYQALERSEEITFTSFAQMNQQADLTFEIVGSGDASNAATLEVKDGSDPVELEIVKSGDHYIVKAADGFNPGCSYELHLADGWTFAGKADTIRTAAFSIAMEEVENLQMSDDIVYIQDTDSMNYAVGGSSYDVLTSALVTEAGGSFNYNGSGLREGQLLCIYVGIHPEERVGNEDTLDPAVYVKVVNATGTTVTFAAMDGDDQTKLYEVPDNFPIVVATLPTATTGTVNINNLDREIYAMMMGEGYDLTAAKAAAEVGDFISLYVYRNDVESEEDVYFGEITAYNAQTGEITFKKTTRKAIEESMNLYMDINVDGEDLLTEEKIQVLETTLYNQVKNSGFVEDAAFTLADIVTKSDGFRNSESIQNILITDANGEPLSDDQLQLLNLGKSFELSDDIELTVELVTKGDQLHFKGGTQLAIGIEAEFEVELVEGDKIVIQLSATFVQEVSIDPTVKGGMVKKEILGCIPVPIGVKVNATIDIKSFTAFSFEAMVYTVPAEEEELSWKQLKDLGLKQLKDMGVNIPDRLLKDTNKTGSSGDDKPSSGDSETPSGDSTQSTAQKGLRVKDIIKRIRELETKAKKAKQIGEEYQGYLNDAQELWDALKEGGLDPDNWKNLAATLDETNICSNLLDQYGLTNETGLSVEYYEGLEGLMGRYQKMLEQESDWVRLVEKEIFSSEYNFYGVAIGTEVKFNVRADMSLAIGSNLQYEIGKRYEFWFKIGLFKPTAGSSTMDLIDESFAFQFYIMGRLGLKAGISAELSVGLGTGELASVGISVEMGPYLKLYGFFIYEYTKTREANTTTWVSNELMAGAVYMEFGLYFVVSFEAQALTKFEYSYDFVDEEIPLVKAGTRRFYYDLTYRTNEEEVIFLKDKDSDSSNGITMKLPTTLTALNYMDIVTGGKGHEVMAPDKYHVTLSNPAFSYDKQTGEIYVVNPNGLRYMESDMTVTCLKHKAAFSNIDLSTTVKLMWTNLADSELNEFYTATVRVGNDADGYETVWTYRTLKNTAFDLPTEEEIFQLMNWNEYKYEVGTGYGDQQTEGVTLVEDRVYDFNIRNKTYSVTVNGIQKPDGTTESRTYKAKFGETFDFSDLAETGTNNKTTGVFTKFGGITAPENIDITKAIDTRMAEALSAGVEVSANYVDYAVTATFTFVGVDIADVQLKLRRGETPDISSIIAMVTDKKASIVEIQPMVGLMNASATYQVICRYDTNPDATITFEENGGSEVADITLPWGSLIQLPALEQTGYDFGGWYADAELTKPFTYTSMPQEGATLYAKWTGKQYTVTFDIYGGTALDGDAAMTVTFGSAYGDLPKASRTNYGFIGWFTQPEGGQQVTSGTIYSVADNQTLYAQWRVLKQIPREAVVVYERIVGYDEDGYGYWPDFRVYPESGETYKKDDFTWKYKRQDKTEYEEGKYAANAGTYDVTVIREADDYYARFEETYIGAVVIEPLEAIIIAGQTEVRLLDAGFTWLKLGQWEYFYGDDYIIVYDKDGDWHQINFTPETKLIFHVKDSKGNVYTADSNGIVRGLPRNDDNLAVALTFVDRNYAGGVWTSEYTIYSRYEHVEGDYKLKEAPDGSWLDYADTSWYNTTDTEFTITTEEQLAGMTAVMKENEYTSVFEGQTIKLGADLDMSAHAWDPGQFWGVFDGQGHTITGLYCDKEDDFNIGFVSSNYGEIKNLVIDDSSFRGYTYVGAIAGYSKGIIENCVSYASVAGWQSVDVDYVSYVGGIAGMQTDSGVIRNCVNYGAVFAQGRHVGGILGYSSGGKVINNANFGAVNGSSRVGGIVGTTNADYQAIIYNNYNAGSVGPRNGSNDYIGAIVGRNMDDVGIAQNNYYLEGCAKGGDGKNRQAMGKSGGSVTDGEKDYFASSFQTMESELKESAGTYAGMTLLEALNAWIDDNGSAYEGVVGWEVGSNGYPMPVSISTRAE